MTIFLPQDISMFRPAFDETCERILQSNRDEVFYALLVQLITKLRENPLLKERILQVETESSKRQKEFSEAALQVHEYNWKKLWQYHRHNYTHRKDLARIKREVTSPRTVFSSPLHIRIGSALWEFRCRSPFFRFLNEAPGLFRNAQSDMRLWVIHAHHFSSSKEVVEVLRKVISLKFKKRDKMHWLYLRACKLAKPKKSRPHKSRFEQIASLFSPFAGDLESKYILPGQNSQEKRRNMLIKAEIDFTYCWERLRFLEQCYHTSSVFPTPKRFSGKWEAIRNIAWHAAWERCEEEALHWAKMSLRQNLSSTPNSSLDVFLSCEKQINRIDFDAFLKAIQRHIHTQLFVIECSKPKIEENTSLVSAGTQSANFVIDLAQRYWKNNPQAIYDDVFSDYLTKCPESKLLSRSSWERIIRKRKLDPRPPGTKKRGKAQKSF